MENKFTSEFDRGILSKPLFLESPVTQDFVSWIKPYINGERSLTDLNYPYHCFTEAVNNYYWGKSVKEDFDRTYNRFAKYRDDFKSQNESIIRKNCNDVLNWGGVAAKNQDKIEVRESLYGFIQSVLNLVNQNEIIIDDLNPNYINSGFTKIYAASDENFIMYDGRVGSALCYLIKNYLDKKEISQIPAELSFGYGIGRGNHQRNPSTSTDSFKFPEITQNRSVHFISNIKANWLAESIAGTGDLFGQKIKSKNIFAFQTALFTLGEEIPKSK